tara:strand:- start:221 stop:676 length:456 start_codon:yes stop_codon:yes gene_type:complete
MSYSDKQILKIHNSGTANYKTLYTDNLGNTYIGTINGRLQSHIPPLTTSQKLIIEPISEITIPETIEILESSYFGIDSNGDLTPLTIIENVLTTNLFTLDVTTGDLTPNNAGINDIFFTKVLTDIYGTTEINFKEVPSTSSSIFNPNSVNL